MQMIQPKPKNLNDIRKIRDQIHWNMTLQSSMVGLTDVHITSIEDSDRLRILLKERAGYFFYICVWNFQTVLCIIHRRANNLAISRRVDINILGLCQMMEVAVSKQGGTLTIPGQYEISDEIRMHLQQAIDEPI